MMEQSQTKMRKKSHKQVYNEPSKFQMFLSHILIFPSLVYICICICICISTGLISKKKEKEKPNV